jgi:hypothetical protein
MDSFLEKGATENLQVRKTMIYVIRLVQKVVVFAPFEISLYVEEFR